MLERVKTFEVVKWNVCEEMFSQGQFRECTREGLTASS